MAHLRWSLLSALVLLPVAAAAEVTVIVCPIDDPNCVSEVMNPREVDAGGNGSDAGSQFDAANNLDFGPQVDAGDGGIFSPSDGGGAGAAIGESPGVMLGNGTSPAQDRGCQMLGRGPGGPLFPALLFGMVMAWYSGRTRRRR